MNRQLSRNYRKRALFVLAGFISILAFHSSLGYQSLSEQSNIMTPFWGVVCLAIAIYALGPRLFRKLTHRPTPQRSRLQSIIQLILAVVIITFGVAYLARGWIRQTVIPSGVNILYMKTIDRDFNQFTPINKLLAPTGIKMSTPPDVIANGRCGGVATYFNDFSETIPCTTFQQGTQPTLTSNFEVSWQRQAPALESYLHTTGWQIDNSFNYGRVRSLDAIFSAGADLRYTKSIAKDTCTFEVLYVPQSNGLPLLTIYESCERDVNLFGGSDYA